MRRPYNNTATFLDFLFNVLFGIFVLFSISVVMLSVEKEKNTKTGDVILKAEYALTMEWDEGSLEDIDLFLTLPTGKVVYYNHPNQFGSSLDRDDRGSLNDRLILEDGTIMSVEDNWEHIFIRKVIPGQYTVHVNFFSGQDMKKPINIRVKLEKLNPYSLVLQNTIVLTKIGETKTAFTFTLDKDGKITNRSTTIQRPLIIRREM